MKRIKIIAEIGVNHNGSLKLALDHISAAKDSGCDFVKFQFFDPREFMLDNDQNYTYKVANEGFKTEDTFTMFERLQFDDDVNLNLIEFSRAIGIEPIASASDPIIFDKCINLYNLNHIKISSEDAINIPLLDHALKSGYPLIISTGMMDHQELVYLRSRLAGRTDITIMHCVSQYPTIPQHANINRIILLRDIFCGCTIGYSDHTIGNTASIAAALMGATIIEKHFTIDKSIPGPDNAFSASCNEMKELVSTVKILPYILGNGSALSDGETQSRALFRRSLVAKRNITAGEIFDFTMFDLKRAGVSGLNYISAEKFVGRKIPVDILSGAVISSDLL